MDPLTNLVDYRTQLKDQVAQDLETGLVFVDKRLKTNSVRKNELLLLKGRLSELKEEAAQGTLDEKDRLLRVNRIRADLFSLVDRLSYDDIADGQADFPKQMPASDPIPTNVLVTHTIDDLDIFCNEHREVLATFGTIYRKIREHIIRDNIEDSETGDLMSALEPMLPTLKSYRNMLKAVETKRMAIRTHTRGQVFWLRYKKALTFALQVRVWELDSIQKPYRELQELYEELKSLDLVA